MDICSFPTHGAKQAQFLPGCPKRGQLDARAVRTQSPHDPAPAQLNEWVETAHRLADNRLIQNLRRPLMILRPIAGGGNQGFGRGGDSAAMPVGDGDISRVSQASKAGDAASHAIEQIPGGHQMLESVDRADWHDSLHAWQGIHFRPEVNWIAQFTLCNLPQPFMVLSQDEWHSPATQAFAIALEER